MSSKGKRWIAGILIPLFVIVPFGGYFIFKKIRLKAINATQNEAEQLAEEITQLRGEYQQIHGLYLTLALCKQQLSHRSTALDVLDVVALHIPDEVTLDSLVFSESRGSGGNNITMRGKVEQDDRQKLQGYADNLATVQVIDALTETNRILFTKVQPPNMDARAGGYLDWYIVCLIRKESEEKPSTRQTSTLPSVSPVKYKRKDSHDLLFDRIKKKDLEMTIDSFKKERALLQNKFASMPPLATLKSEVETLQGMSDVRISTGEDQARKLMDTLEQKARRSGLRITRSRGSQVAASNNKGVEEYKRTISFQTDTIQLVDFLKNVTEEQSMTRVSDMKMFPTPDRRYLKVDLTFVASYPKLGTYPKPSKASKKKGRKK